MGGKPAAARLGIAFCLGGLVSLAGCGRAPFPVAPVHGKVTVDGKPLSTGKILFAPVAQGENMDAGKWAIGALQPDGSFVLSTYGENDGAVVGEHWATVVSSPNAPASVPKFGRVKVPRKIVVEAGKDNDVLIALTAQELRRFDRRSN
jgi:hypothetical protein